jgi:hypothetical protein
VAYDQRLGAWFADVVEQVDTQDLKS